MNENCKYLVKDLFKICQEWELERAEMLNQKSSVIDLKERMRERDPRCARVVANRGLGI